MTGMNIKLSSKQSAIVYAEDGPILVKASAGSGKTRVLTERISYLLAKTQRKVLAITFTNKAAEEMKERLGSQPDISDKTFIGTFHGFCNYVLSNHGSSLGLFPMPHIFEEETDRTKLVEAAIAQTPSLNSTYLTRDARSQGYFCRDALDFISRTKRELLSETELSGRPSDKDLVLLYQTYQEMLSSQNAIDFDDLLLLTYRLFVERPKIASLYRRSYAYICVDEAQDLNYAQYSILKALTGNGENRNILMVGDPNQSIYAFTGSSADFMNKHFIEDYQPIVFELNDNFRSSKAVLNAARSIIPDTSDIANTIMEGKFDTYEASDEEDEAMWILREINDLISMKQHHDIEGDICYEKIAILARNKYVFKQMDAALSQDSIPFYYKKSPGPLIFESESMKLFDMGLRVILNPQDNLHMMRLYELLETDFVSNQKGIEALTDIHDHVQLRHFTLVLEALTQLKEDGSNFKSSMTQLRDEFITLTSISDDAKAMILHDITEIILHWYNYAKKADVKNLNSFRNALALGQTHPLAQHNGITLSTVHTMKGQEFDIVFLMGMDDGTFPDYRAIQKGGIDMTQEKNNAYVAFTRAKRFLYVSWPNSRLMPWGDTKHRNKSRFLSSLST